MSNGGYTCMSNGGYTCMSNGGYTCMSNGGYTCMSNGSYTCMSNGGYRCMSNGGYTCMSNGDYTCVHVYLLLQQLHDRDSCVGIQPSGGLIHPLLLSVTHSTCSTALGTYYDKMGHVG